MVARDLQGDDPVSYDFYPMNETSARIVATWRYPAPYDIYDTPPDAVEEAVQGFLDPQYAYHALTNEGEELVAYCCFGLDARVPGGDYGFDALDIGMGVRPDLTGQGRGAGFVRAVLAFAQDAYAPVAFRVTVAEFNERAQRVWKKADFGPEQTFARRGDGMAFVVLTLKNPH